MIELTEKERKNLRILEFVESASTNPITQNVLLESLNSDEQSEGRFKNSEEMFSHMMKEWEEKDSNK